MPHDDNPEKMARMHAWLDQVAADSGVEPELVADNEDALLHLISTVAHGPSRPGAPLTAFIVGVAVGRGADPAPLIARIDAAAAQADR